MSGIVSILPRLIPFVIGMGAGYLFALILTLIGYYGFNNPDFKIIDFSPIVDNFVITVTNEEGEIVSQSFRGFTAFLDFPKFLFLS